MYGERPLCAIDHPARWVAYHPHDLALTGAGVRWTWAQLDERVRRTATRLTRDLGLRRGDRVAILALNHPFFFELAYACFRTGLVLAPLNYRLAPRELDALLDLAEPGLLLVDGAHAEIAAGLDWAGNGRVESLEAWAAEPDGTFDDDPAWHGTEMEEPAVILFTSGTTGLPKAAVLPVRQLFFNAVNTQTAFRLTGDDSTVLYTPLFHTGAINVLALPLFHCGGRVHVLTAFDAGRIWETIGAEQVSTIFGVPTTFRMLADHAAFDSAAKASLRLCLCGGAPLPTGLIREYEAAGMVLTQGFGMTEAGVNCFYLPPREALARAGSVGRPMPYCRARVVRPDGTAAGTDEVGELQLAGPHLFLGYFRNPEATAAAFDGEWFRTGDLAKRDSDGFFSIAGRAKEMFISGGENVYPAEIEVVLAGFEDVVEAAVVPLPDARWGEVGCAWVVARDSRCTVESLKARLRTALAGYKVPKRFLFVDALPRNPSGKVLKQELVEEAKSHAA